MSQRRSALGRGLGALISNPATRSADAAQPPRAKPASVSNPLTSTQETPNGVDTVKSHSESSLSTNSESGRIGPEMLEIALIDPNPEQPRREFDARALDQLAQSIVQHGVLQPVVVRKAGTRYELVMGERRFRASQQAGRQTIPAVVADVADADRLELAIVENVQRQDLNPIELAHAYQALAEAGNTQDEIGRKVAKDRSSIANHIRLLDLSRGIQSDVEAGRLSMGHAKALLQLPDVDAREALRGQILSQGLSVRATEKAARDQSGSASRKRGVPPAKVPTELDADTRAFVDRIERNLQTHVSLHRNNDGSGKLEIKYFNLEDLERIGGMLLGGE